MAINSISDLLAVGWEHAYCTEGPEFVIPSGSGGMQVGPMSMTPASSGGLDTWPDEIGTADLTVNVVGSGPLYEAANPDLGNRPTVNGNSTNNGVMRVDITDIPQPYNVIVIGRMFVDAVHNLFEGSPTSPSGPQVVSFGTNTTQWSGRTGGTSRAAGTRDTVGHLFDFRGDIGGVQYALDGVVIRTLVASGSAQFVKLSIFGNTNATAFHETEIAFLGIKSSWLTAGEEADILAFAQSHWNVP